MYDSHYRIVTLAPCPNLKWASSAQSARSVGLPAPRTSHPAHGTSHPLLTCTLSAPHSPQAQRPSVRCAALSAGRGRHSAWKVMRQDAHVTWGQGSGRGHTETSALAKRFHTGKPEAEQPSLGAQGMLVTLLVLRGNDHADTMPPGSLQDPKH